MSVPPNVRIYNNSNHKWVNTVSATNPPYPTGYTDTENMGMEFTQAQYDSYVALWNTAAGQDIFGRPKHHP